MVLFKICIPLFKIYTTVTMQNIITIKEKTNTGAFFAATLYYFKGKRDSDFFASEDLVSGRRKNIKHFSRNRSCDTTKKLNKENWKGRNPAEENVTGSVKSVEINIPKSRGHFFLRQVIICEYSVTPPRGASSTNKLQFFSLLANWWNYKLPA